MVRKNEITTVATPVPLKRGHNFDSAPIGPFCVNCPTENSKYL